MTENVVGRASVEIDPDLNRRAATRFRRDLKKTSSQAMKGVSESLRQEFGKLPKTSGFSKAMQQQRAEATASLRGITKTMQEETNSWSKLQKQRASAVEAANARQAKSMKELSRSFDTQLIMARNALKRGQMDHQQYAASTNRIMDAAKNAGLGMDDLVRKMSSISVQQAPTFIERMGKMSSHLSNMSARFGIAAYQAQMFGQMLTTLATVPIAGGLAAAAKVGIDVAGDLEASFIALQGLNPGKNLVPFFKDMIEFGKKSPVFEITEMTAALSKFSGAGMTPEESGELIKAMGTFGLARGMDPNKMNNALNALAQMAGKQQVMSEELKTQFSEAMPGGMGLAAEALGISVDRLLEIFGSQGKEKIAWDDFYKGFIRLSKTKKYTDAAAKGTTTLNAAIANLKETMKITLAEQFLDDSFKVRPEIMEGLQKLGDALGELIKTLGETGVFNGMISGFTRIAEVVSKAIKSFAGLSDEQKQLVIRIAGVAAALGPLTMAFSPLLNTMATFSSLGSGVFGVLGGIGTKGGLIVGAITAVAAGFSLLIAKSASFRSAVFSAVSSFAKWFDKYLMPAVRGAWEQLVILGRKLSSLGINVKLLGNIMKIFAGVTIALWTAIFRVIQGVVWVVNNGVLPALRKVVSFASSYMIPILRGIAKAYNALGKVMPWAKIAGSGVGAAADAIESVNDALQKTKDTAGEVAGPTFSAVDALGDLQGVLGGGSTEADRFASKMDRLKDSILGVKSASEEGVDADDNWHKAKIRLTESLKQNGDTLDKNTQSGQDNRDALKDAIKAENEKTLALIKQKGPSQAILTAHKKRIDALIQEAGKSKATSKEARILAKTYDKIPRDVKTLLDMIGFDGVYSSLEKLQISQLALKNGGDAKAAKKDYDKLIKTRGQLQDLYRTGKGFASGGWTGPGSKFQPAGIVHADEHVINKDSRRKIESVNPGLLDYINKKGALPPQYANGGQVWPFKIDVSKTMVDKAWAQDVISSSGIVNGGGGGSVGNYKAMYAWIKSKVPGTRLTSGYRPGPKYHGTGQATDLTFSDGSERRGGGKALSAFNIIKSTFMKSIKELIWDFAGNKAVWNGRNHFYTGPNAGPGTHDDHIHWAMDNGGPFQDRQSIKNYSGKPEMVLNNPQAHALEERLRGGEPIDVKVYIGDREIKDIVKVEVNNKNAETAHILRRGRKG